jgi:hypothetical protein
LLRSEEQFRLFVQSVAEYAIFSLDADGRVARPGESRGTKKRKSSASISLASTPRGTVPWGPGARPGDRSSERAMGKQGLGVRKDATTFWAHVVIHAILNERGEVVADERAAARR